MRRRVALRGRRVARRGRRVTGLRRRVKRVTLRGRRVTGLRRRVAGLHGLIGRGWLSGRREGVTFRVFATVRRRLGGAVGASWTGGAGGPCLRRFVSPVRGVLVLVGHLVRLRLAGWRMPAPHQRARGCGLHWWLLWELAPHALCRVPSLGRCHAPRAAAALKCSTSSPVLARALAPLVEGIR